MIPNKRMLQVAKRPIYQCPYPIPRMLMPPATIIAFLPSVACEEWRTHRSFSRSGSGATPKGRIYECEPGKGKTFVDLDLTAEPELPFEACGHSGSGYVISATYELANRSTVGDLKGRLFAYIVCCPHVCSRIFSPQRTT